MKTDNTERALQRGECALQEQSEVPSLCQPPPSSGFPLQVVLAKLVTAPLGVPEVSHPIKLQQSLPMTLPKSRNGDLINSQGEKFVCVEMTLGVTVTLKHLEGTHLSTRPLRTSLPAWRGLD